ncbi:MAG: sigma-70 family RNA polymerase sigma factor [Spirochaetia bacterium]|nr:sigma-70 family RNA polymerase sigma factor [Spirochaetia bacterium]
MLKYKTEDALDKEDQVKNIIKQLKEGNSEKISEFFNLYSDDIYNFPIRFYQFNEDEAGDFYVYAFEHLENGKRLKFYSEKSKFSTWFYSVLRNLTIDFLRAKKEKVKTVSTARLDDNGHLQEFIDSIPDKRLSNEEPIKEKLFYKKFKEKLNNLEISKRVLLKLAYIYYMDLTVEEIKWLQDNHGANTENILTKLIELKEIAHEKSKEVVFVENKLTENFQKIQKLQEKLDSFFKENPSIKPDAKNWSADYENKDIPPEIIEQIHSLMKKKKKQISLLEQQEKSLSSTRLPYKNLSEILNTSQGVLSVQLHRIIEKFDVFK